MQKMYQTLPYVLGSSVVSANMIATVTVSIVERRCQRDMQEEVSTTQLNRRVMSCKEVCK